MSEYIAVTRHCQAHISGLKDAVGTFEYISSDIVRCDLEELSNNVISTYNQKLYSLTVAMEMHTDALRMLMEEQMNCEDPPLTQNLINSQLRKTNTYDANLERLLA